MLGLSLTTGFLLLLAFGASWGLTRLVRGRALARGRLAEVNARSSHSQPTPQGGGLSFAVVFLLAVPVFIALFPEQRDLWLALLGGVPIALIGWFDDRKEVSARLRLGVHIVSALWALVWLGPLTTLELGFALLPLGLFGAALSFVGIVWFINLYNFMDGIDGLAGGQAFVTAAVAACCFLALGLWPLALACAVLAAAVAGFLAWNWPRARIFMGDVGSGTLGFFFAVLALWSEGRGALPLLVWLLFLCPFVVDATLTLVRRVLQGKQWHLGHRTHAYQLAVQRGYSHARVTNSVLLIDLGLGALAAFALFHPNYLLPALVLAVLSLYALWHYLTVPQFVPAKPQPSVFASAKFVPTQQRSPAVSTGPAPSRAGSSDTRSLHRG